LRHGGGGDRIWCSLRLEWLTEVITTASAKVESGQKIAGLVEKYRSLSPSEIKKFNEAMTKQGFIEPMFRALGWDFDDVNEVTPEESASKGRVDYAFKLNGVAQFYVEAKSLKADLTNPEYVKQAITYAYNKGVTWALLTDFEGLRLFNAQKNTPYINLSYQDYVARLDKLWLLSRDSLEKGLLNKEAAQDGALPLSVPIEKRLFNQLRQWREDLYNQLSGYNENLSLAQIDQAIQRLLNRLIFIRTCEDRNIEERRLLAAVHQWQSSGHKKDKLAETLRHIFHEFDGYYDSELFATHIIDSDQVFIQEPTIEGILNGLYDIPGAIASYDFSLIDADVLGQVYEQYLGYVATKTKQKLQAQMTLGLQGEALVEFSEKKQHRKEQGIYYTPKFVTNYVVKETVGRFLAERSHNEVLSMKILDPACGSGSFLIRAYDELLNYHAAQRGKTAVQLDHFDRMPVLTGNVFGVDLDRQAIEITRLNLLLRGLAKRETLPTLADNIREGNSLISGTEEELKGYFGDAWQVKKPFNWEEEFADIMKGGGFDVVIGNPPWVSVSGKQKSLDLSEPELKYLFDKFDISTSAPNLYEVFIWRALSLLKEGGLFSFIIPDRLAANQQFIRLREYVLKNFTVEKLLFRYPFPGVIADTLVIVMRKAKGENNVIEITDYPTQIVSKVPQSTFLSSPDFALFFVDPKLLTVFQKITGSKGIRSLGAIVKSTSGCGAKSSLLHKTKKGKKEIQVIKGENIGRYRSEGCFWFEFKDENLSGRTRDEMKLGSKEKVLIRKTGSDIIATFDDTGMYPEQSLYFLYGASRDMLLYLLGIINSRLVNTYYRNFAVTNRDTTPQLKNVDLDKFPIATATNKSSHDALVTRVESMLELQRQLAPIRGEEHDSYERDYLLGQIEKTDREIDNLAYDLYGLTEEERKIVETAA